MNRHKYNIGNIVNSEQGITIIVNSAFGKYQVSGIKGRHIWAENISPVLFTEEWLLKFGFDKKPLVQWYGNGQDNQNKTSQTTQQDYVLELNGLYLIVRYEIWQWRENEQAEWNLDPTQMMIYITGNYYEKNDDGQIYFRECKYIHDFQNICYELLRLEFYLKLKKLQ